RRGDTDARRVALGRRRRRSVRRGVPPLLRPDRVTDVGGRAATFLTRTGAVSAVGALTSLLLLLPPAPGGERRNSDYDSPTTPLHSGGIAVGCFLYGLVALLVGIGLAFGLPRGERRRARRPILLALATVLVAGAALVADAVRWTCWP